MCVWILEPYASSSYIPHHLVPSALHVQLVNCWDYQVKAILNLKVIHNKLYYLFNCLGNMSKVKLGIFQGSP